MSGGAVAADWAWMERALALARRGEGRVSPNPLVGAVLVRDGRIVGEGWHRRLGGPHAEIEALRAAGRRARGATLYVTLEPCNHHGRTPPCVDAVVAAGVETVVAAMRDPNPGVAGGGFLALRRAGLRVHTGLLGAQARRLNESYLRHVVSGRPLVLLKCAASLDGRIASPAGRSRWLTGPAARREAHRLRRWSDAVLVGSGTVLADDPRLDVRDGGRAKPIARVVVDGRLRTPPRARFLSAGSGPALVYTLAARSSPRARALRAAGAEVVTVDRGPDGRTDLKEVLADLARRGVGRLLVEGGGELLAAFVRRRLADRAVWFVAPLLLGGDGVAALGPLGVAAPARAPRVDVESVRRIGPDLVIAGRLRPPA